MTLNILDVVPMSFLLTLSFTSLFRKLSSNNIKSQMSMSKKRLEFNIINSSIKVPNVNFAKNIIFDEKMMI